MIGVLESPANVITPACFRREVRRWSKQIGVDVREIRLRSMKRKLASASSAGRLTFDVTLLGSPADHRAEVVVHELVHLRVGNHGPLFRSLVRAYLSDSSGPVRRSTGSSQPGRL
jgi:predicted metal-dependent hydrolase